MPRCEPSANKVAGNAARSKSSLLGRRTHWPPTATTPSAAAARRERAVLLADALEGLPADYREVVILRNLEGLKFSEVAARMGRSSGAIRMLWARAIEQLSEGAGGAGMSVGERTATRARLELEPRRRADARAR